MERDEKHQGIWAVIKLGEVLDEMDNCIDAYFSGDPRLFDRRLLALKAKIDLAKQKIETDIQDA